MTNASKRKSLPINIPQLGLDRNQSAEMIGLSTATFDKLVIEGIMPSPIRLPGVKRRIWDRIALENAFSNLSRKRPIRTSDQDIDEILEKRRKKNGQD